MYKKNYRQLSELFKNGDYVYIYFESAQLCKQFLNQATNEGFYFSKGKKATKNKPADILGVRFDRELCYVGYIGRLNFARDDCNIPRIDYKKFVDGDNDYFYTK